MILFLHGAGIDAGDLTPDAYPLLRRLQRLAPVDAPFIDGDWLDALDTPLGDLGPETSLVAHSHGGAMALKWIAERAPGKTLARFVGCAMPLWGQPDWTMPEFLLPENIRGAFDGLGPVTLLHAGDDEVVDPSHADLYAGILPGATVRHLPRGGHDLDDDKASQALAEALGLSG